MGRREVKKTKGGGKKDVKMRGKKEGGGTGSTQQGHLTPKGRREGGKEGRKEGRKEGE